MTVDQKVYDLACEFLKGAPEQNKLDLAEELQEAIDGFIQALEECDEFEASERAVTEIPSPL